MPVCRQHLLHTVRVKTSSSKGDRAGKEGTDAVLVKSEIASLPKQCVLHGIEHHIICRRVESIEELAVASVTPKKIVVEADAAICPQQAGRLVWQ